ncbi:MAG TPA: TlpA disulfide reductase family protein [Chitinophaga sp.]
MKKNWIVLLGMFPMALLAQGNKVVITGKTAQAENCGVLFSYVAPDNTVKKDTGFVKDDQFSFNSVAYDERVIAQVIVFGQQGDRSILFYLEPGNIQLDVYSGKEGLRRSGTPLNRELQEFVTMETAALDSMNAGKSREEKVTVYHPAAQPVVLEVIAKYMTLHPHSVIGIDQLSNVVRGFKSPDSLTRVYNMMDSAVQHSKQGMLVKAAIEGMRATAIGKVAPDFTLPDTKGQPLTLSSLQHKYVLIDFWATWCAPCMAEMPNVKKAYGQFKDRNFEILGVSLDQPDAKDKWLEVIKRDGLSWPQVSDLKYWDSKVVNLYDLNSIPMNFLLDPSGKIIAKNLRGQALTDKLAEVLQ